MDASHDKRLFSPPQLNVPSGSGEVLTPITAGQISPSVQERFPERYIIKNIGNEQVLICLEAPNLNVHIERGLSISGSMARKSSPGTIFLDGVAHCEPFMDHERQVYNLDHHESCVRAFTLSTCEQALVMYMKGLDLQGREWNIFANEPDLDTLLAIWILLNHVRIGRKEITQRRFLFALVRLEGVIDALGLELKELSALPPDLVRKIQRVIDHLRSEEIVLKKEGRWVHTDFLNYGASILHKIDHIFYMPSDFADFKGVEEIARIDISDHRIAVVVEADMGIYEIEPYLNNLYGNRLGVVFLKKGSNCYTVRQMDLFLPFSLEKIYDRLNFMDPAVKCRTQINKWGGAADIGGSPRKSGSRLNPVEIVQCCKEAVIRQGLGQHLYRFSLTTAMVGLIFIIAYLAELYWNNGIWLSRWVALDDLNPLWSLPQTGLILVLLAISGGALMIVSHNRPWQYGWIWPIGKNWYFFFPIVILSGLTGGVWAPLSLIKNINRLHLFLLYVIGMPLSSELLFRSLAHGLLAQEAHVQRYDTQWFVSWPMMGSALLYTGFIFVLTFMMDFGIDVDIYWRGIETLGSAIVFALSLAMVRERSQSLFPAILFHFLAAATVGIIQFT